ncbi:pupal cuticle protein C1B-like [Colletes gigas]|uniref:pupal cuticle protein C1B-like n=1 Tax=Colletes gigas TaxID=935657 RepID=UPI001C9B74DD|nr:pupal cuticle protein C1B-like [Colletes gigas]
MSVAQILVLFAGLFAACSAGLLPAAVPAAYAAPIPAAYAAPIPAALTVGTYASSYNAHAINHAYAAPYYASPVVAHAAPVAHYAYSGLPAAALIAGRR